MKPILSIFVLGVLGVQAFAQTPTRKTYCNPINIDYGYYDYDHKPVDRPKMHSSADPLILTYHGDYYLFSTNQLGYWWSPDMSSWHFVSHPFLSDEIRKKQSLSDLCAPMVYVYKDEMYIMGSDNPDWAWPVWKSSNPKAGIWSEAVHSFKTGPDDPGVLIDDDGRMYLYQGSSNTFPINAWEIDPVTFAEKTPSINLLSLHPDVHGWERFGESNDNVFLQPFIEGAWMTKHNGKYYLQYAAPGTEQTGYGDGVYVGDHPLGPFTYQGHNPFSSKIGGFAQGAGHGATYEDLYGNWWHIATMGISVKDNFERRIGMWPAGFDADGVLYSNSAYGDYPTYLPSAPHEDHVAGNFTGWMLLNYQKPVRVSSTLGAHSPNYAVDESIKTYWSAATGNEGEWIESDLGAVSTVRAIQINYADQDATLEGKPVGTFHRYKLLCSSDGRSWKTLVDKSRNNIETPHDYIELPQPVETRYVKLINLHVPSGKFAISGLRVFGRGHGAPPKAVKNFVALRGTPEPRAAWLKWAAEDDATGYVVHVGTAPDKLYTSFMVLGANDYDYKALDVNTDYYFRIEAFNENGRSELSPIQKSAVPK